MDMVADTRKIGRQEVVISYPVLLDDLSRSFDWYGRGGDGELTVVIVTSI